MPKPITFVCTLQVPTVCEFKVFPNVDYLVKQKHVHEQVGLFYYPQTPVANGSLHESCVWIPGQLAQNGLCKLRDPQAVGNLCLCVTVTQVHEPTEDSPLGLSHLALEGTQWCHVKLHDFKEPL